ncbi:MAG TPA: ABC transporter ATP-binding protein [Phycisphaeraceae bacterium]
MTTPLMSASADPAFPPASAPQPVLRLEQVRFGYEPGVAVVDGVSGTLHAGRLCCLLGPNAAGKTTLMRLILGQLTPWSGQVTLDSRPISALPPKQRARWISYVPQQGGVRFSFTVEQVVRMGRYAWGGGESAVQEALHRCELTHLAHRIFSQLSGGQQQRVLIARAVAQSIGQGRLMLLDEPVNNLDLRHQHHMMHLLHAQARRGLAVLAVLHDVNLAARYADEVWLMDHGRLLAAGPWQEVLTPAVLEPVYRVGFQMMQASQNDRPLFRVEPQDKL